jgi:hypothetical protein
MSVIFNDDDCGYTETRGSRGFVRIGSRYYSETRPMADATTPRELSRNVPDQGINADRIQSALLYVGPSRRERLIDAAWWVAGVLLVFALLFLSFRVELA